jgi:phytoene desaturase (3,4-didehydrolycopene-forming)
MFKSVLFLALVICNEHVAFKIKNVRDVAVIGGGVGGIISSTLLAKSGLNVLLIEKNAKCGGRMNSEFISHPTEKNASYRFDVGPSLLLLPDVYRETFELLGTKIEDHVELLRVEPFYRCYFEEDGTFAEISSDIEKMKSITNSIEPNSYEKFVDYLKTAGDFLRFGLPTVIQEKPDFTHFGSFVMACIKVFPLRSHDSMLKQYFKSPKLRAMMSFQDLYIGLSPYESPAIFCLLQALELERGIFYPKGGFEVVAKALESIARRAGVDIVNNCKLEGIQLSFKDVWRDDPKGMGEIRTIQSINVNVMKPDESSILGREIASLAEKKVENTDNIIIGDGTAGTVTMNEAELREAADLMTHHSISADTFITNIDAPEFENALVSVSERDERTAVGVPSCGIVSLHFALNTTLRSLSHHTLYLSKSYRNSWNVVDNPDDAAFNPAEFNFYVHCPSRTDSTVCPPGHDAITVLVPVPPLPSSGKGKHLDKYVVRKVIIDRLQEMEDSFAGAARSSDSTHTAVIVADHIVAESIREPEGWRREFGLYRGSAFGLAHSIDQLNILRPRLRHPLIKNLFRYVLTPVGMPAPYVVSHAVSIHVYLRLLLAFHSIIH